MAQRFLAASDFLASFEVLNPTYASVSLHKPKTQGQIIPMQKQQEANCVRELRWPEYCDVPDMGIWFLCARASVFRGVWLDFWETQGTED